MKKVIILISLLALLSGCSINNVNNEGNSENTAINNIDSENQNEINDEEKVITEFNALGKTYTENKDILPLNAGELLYDNKGDNPYVVGEYKEVDFAVDLIIEYLSGSDEIYNNVIDHFDDNSEDIELISESEKERLIESTDFLRTQMDITSEDPIYFKLDKINYNGVVGQSNNGVSIEVRGFISAVDGYFASISTFTVEVYKNKDKLYGIIR